MCPSQPPRTSVATAQRTGHAMGSDLHLVGVGDADGTRWATPAAIDDALAAAEARIRELERCWSRFLPDSDLCRLNAAGHLDDAGDDLLLAVGAAVDAWRATDARFDPTVLPALERAGYDLSFDALGTATGRLTDPPGPVVVDDRPIDPVPGPVGIEVDPVGRRIVLPAGVRLDLGGIGKGLAADLAAVALIDAGLSGACVNLGGDVRAIGRPPDGSAWVVAVEDPFQAGRELTRVAFGDGAVATSALVRRRWVGADGLVKHHLIDPATGRPADRGTVAVTVLAREARWAEVLTKAAFVAGPETGAALIEDAGGAALIVTATGSIERCGGFEAFESRGPGPAG